MESLNMIMGGMEILADGIDTSINLSLGSLVITSVIVVLNGMIFAGVALLVWRHGKINRG